MKRLKALDWILILVFLAGASIFLYPAVSDLWNRYRNRQLISEYEETASVLDSEKLEQTWKIAREYQEQHTVNVIKDAFENEDYVLSHPYDTILNINQDEIMGSLSIPKLGLNLAIYHGVGSDVLEKGCGHVEGTSLPIGGKSTHCVLAAHRGLPSAKLFTDLDQMEKGDLFYIRVLDETLAYKVDKISVVLPEETEELEIVPGEDYVTLLTCTPYGINSHRLLVRGKRTEYVEDEKKSLEQEKKKEQNRILILTAGAAAFAVSLYIIVKKQRKKERDRQ